MKNKRENGEVVVEASIIVTLVFIVISIMFYIGMVLYQNTAVSVIANRTATNISQVYSNTLRDPFTGYVDPEKAYQSVTYSTMKTDADLDVISQKGKVLGQYRLINSQIIPSVSREVDVQVVKKPNEVLKAQVVVTITDSYNVPLVAFFGADGELSFTATGRADCVDYLEYFLGVEAMADPENSPISSIQDSNNCIVTFITDQYSGGWHASVPVLSGKSIITSNRYSHSTMPENPTYNGLRFTGWKTVDGRVFTATTTVNSNMTVYGSWECTVNFDADGGTVNPSVIKVPLRKSATFPTPVRSGYAFEGWYTQKNGGGEKYVSNITEITGNITLYAKWRCLHVSISKTLKNSGTCVRRSEWICKCNTCPYVYEEKGNYGKCEAGSYSITLEPSCTSNGSKIANCKYCGKVLSATKTSISALGHTFQAYERASTCYQAGIRGQKCTRCGYEEGSALPLAEHTWNGRCGKTHDVSHNVIVIKSHKTSAGYKHSKKVECYLCSVCAAPYNGWRYDKYCADGCTISNGVICREHKDNSGEHITDNAYMDNINMHVHG